MKSFLPCLLAALCMAGCVRASGEPADPILGDWKGVGMVEWLRVEFKPDGSFRRYDVGRTDDAKHGRWVRSGGRYSLTDSGGDARRSAARLESQGRLSIEFDDTPGEKYVLERRGGAGGAGSVSAGARPEGEWRYAYTTKSWAMPGSPAPFDTMTFTGEKVLLRNSAAFKEWDRPYRISGSRISISIGEGAPEFEFEYRIEKGAKDATGDRLVLSTGGVEQGAGGFEWVFLRPEGFVELDVAGVWEAPPEMGAIQEVEFKRDGGFASTTRTEDGRVIRQNNRMFRDFYRIWPARFGPTITMVMHDPQMSSSLTVMYACQRSDAGLVMTPVEPKEDGRLVPHPELKQVWKSKSATPAAPAPASASAPAAVLAEPPPGEWRFAYTSKSPVLSAAPPAFDAMTFRKGRKVRLTSTKDSKDFERAYEFTDGVLSIPASDDGFQDLELEVRLEEVAGAKWLRLSTPGVRAGDGGFEWSYLPPDAFVALDLEGTWVAPAEEGSGRTEEFVFGPDGDLIMQIGYGNGGAQRMDERSQDFYRLWSAPFGTALTIAFRVSPVGPSVSQIFKCEKGADGLALTPVEVKEDGSFALHEEAKRVLRSE